MENFAHLLESLVYALIGLGVFFIIKFSRKILLYKESEDEQLAKNNLAVSLNLSGLYIALGISILAALSGESHTFIKDVTSVFIYSLVGIVMITIFSKVQFYLIIGNKIKDYLKEGNIAAGIIAFGTYVNIGIVTLGSFFGEGTIASAVVFFILGQAALIATTYAWEKINKFDVTNFITGNSIAGAVLYTLTKISLAIIIYASIRGNFTAWIPDLIHFTYSLVAGVVFIMILFNKILDKFVLPETDTKTEIEQGNVASAFLIGSIKIALALIISGII
jgi:uncharacterized membrane protein YjfL (UPF0719 family)